MTSKTFKSAVTNRTLTVEGFFNGAFSVVFSDDSSRDLMLQGDDAPALALAILEAAGVEDSSSGGRITGARIAVGDLRRHVAKLERATAEAKEQAELEAEALELYRAHWLNRYDWAEVEHKGQWLAVARKAREMAKELTNGR